MAYGSGLPARSSLDRRCGFMTYYNQLKEQEPRLPKLIGVKEGLNDDDDIYIDHIPPSVSNSVHTYQTSTLFCYVDQRTSVEFYQNYSDLRPDKYVLMEPHTRPITHGRLRRDSLDFYISDKTDWNTTIPLDISFMVLEEEMFVDERRLAALINNSVYIRERLAKHMQEGLPRCVINFTEEFLDNEMYFGIIAQEISWRDALRGVKEFNIHNFLHFTHCYGFTEAYIITLINFNTHIPRNILTQAIYTSYKDLHWDTLAKLMTYNLLQLQPSYLLFISQLDRKVFKNKLRAAVRSKERAIDIRDERKVQPHCLKHENFDTDDWDDLLQVVSKVIKRSNVTSINRRRIEIKWWLMYNGVDYRKHDPRFKRLTYSTAQYEELKPRKRSENTVKKSK